MDERAAIAVLSGERQDLPARILRSGCHCASWVYSALIALRNRAYDYRALPVAQVPVPVISVGNLTTGGTGKTPVVAWLVGNLIQRGYRPGILSRGYRSQGGAPNDEALVLERLCPGTPHIQGKDRVRGAHIAISKHQCDVLVLDDGYQHRRLHRDLDLLLIDATQPWGYGHVLPRGLLREPVSQSARADLVLVTRVETPGGMSDLPEIAALLRRYRGSNIAATSRFRPARWISADGRIDSIDRHQPCRMAAFCGIGNPGAFWRTLAPLGEVAATRAFPDHHHYTSADLDALERWRGELGVKILATTLKDLVKIPAHHPLSHHVWAVDIGCEITTGQQRIDLAINSICPPRAVERRAA